jgi:hypothetical protein
MSEKHETGTGSFADHPDDLDLGRRDLLKLTGAALFVYDP